MMRCAAKKGFTAGFLGVFLLLLLAGMRLLFRADSDAVYLGSHKINMACAIRERFGRPCPGCGLTRSVVLTLRGNFREAATLNPVGLLGVVGVAVLGVVLLCLSRYQQQHGQPDIDAFEHRVRYGTLAYGVLLVLVLFGHWFWELAVPGLN